MIVSQYNNFFKKSNKYYVYNILTQALIEISQLMHDYLKDGKLSMIDDCKIKIFKDAGIIVNSKESELQYLQFRHNSIKYSKSHVTYIIYPTLTCNLDCPYCFEKVKRECICEEDYQKLKLFLINKAKDGKLTYFHLRWSGGEPLIVWDKIKIINEEIKALCKLNNIEFSSSISTNATLATSNVGEQIYKLNFSQITISIDGPPKIHNQRRFYQNKEGSFKDVIKGINNISQFSKVILRVNIDKINIKGFEELLQELTKCLEYKANVSIYLKPILPGQDCCIDESMYTDLEFFKVEEDLISLTKNFGFKTEFHPGFEKATRCPAYQLNSFMIDPKLNMFKCSKHIGVESKRVGYIDSKGIMKIEDVSTIYKYTNYSPFNNVECKECKVLPLCYGKCPVRWEELGFQEHQACIPEKHTICKKIEYFLADKYLNNNEI